VKYGSEIHFATEVNKWLPYRLLFYHNQQHALGILLRLSARHHQVVPKVI